MALSIVHVMILNRMVKAMKKIGIAITDPADWTASAFIGTVRRYGMEPQAFDLRQAEASIDIDPEYTINGTDLRTLDALIVRDMGTGKNEAVTFRFDILRQLEQEGVLIANPPSTIQNAANKYYTSYLLSKAGLPTPATKLVQDAKAAMSVIDSFGDALLKPVFGYKGIGIHRISNGEVIRPDGTRDTMHAEDLVASLIEEKGMLYIQEFVENKGRDIRVFVVDGKVRAAIYRKATPGWWLNNLSQGGSAHKCILSDEQRTICEEAADALGAVFAGVDLIEGKDTSMLLEVNGTPSGAGIFKAWGIDVTECIMEAIIERL